MNLQNASKLKTTRLWLGGSSGLTQSYLNYIARGNNVNNCNIINHDDDVNDNDNNKNTNERWILLGHEQSEPNWLIQDPKNQHHIYLPFDLTKIDQHDIQELFQQDNNDERQSHQHGRQDNYQSQIISVFQVLFPTSHENIDVYKVGGTYQQGGDGNSNYNLKQDDNKRQHEWELQIVIGIRPPLFTSKTPVVADAYHFSLVNGLEQFVSTIVSYNNHRRMMHMRHGGRYYQRIQFVHISSVAAVNHLQTQNLLHCCIYCGNSHHTGSSELDCTVRYKSLEQHPDRILQDPTNDTMSKTHSGENCINETGIYSSGNSSSSCTSNNSCKGVCYNDLTAAIYQSQLNHLTAPYDRFKRACEIMLDQIVRIDKQQQQKQQQKLKVQDNQVTVNDDNDLDINPPTTVRLTHIRLGAIFSDHTTCIQCCALYWQCILNCQLSTPIDCNSSANVAAAIQLILSSPSSISTEIFHAQSQSEAIVEYRGHNYSTTNMVDHDSYDLIRYYYYTRPTHMGLKHPIPYGSYVQSYRSAYDSRDKSGKGMMLMWNLPEWIVSVMAAFIHSISFMLGHWLPYIDSIDYLLQVSQYEHSFDCHPFVCTYPTIVTCEETMTECFVRRRRLQQHQPNSVFSHETKKLKQQ